MPDVFLPLSKDDDAARVLSKALEAHGWTVWPGSQNLYIEADVTAIEDAFDDSKAFIVVWSEDMAQSRWIRFLAAFALRDDKLIQLKTEGIDIPERFRGLPSFDVPALTGQPAIAWSDWQKFKETLQAIVAPQKEASPISRLSVIDAEAKTIKRPSAMRSARATGEPEDFNQHYRSRFSRTILHPPIEQPAMSEAKPANRWVIPAAAGLAVLALAGFLSVRLLSDPADTALTSTNPDIQALLVQSSARWSELDQTDPAAIREFLEAFPAGPDAPVAARLLDALEEDAWFEARYEEDAILGLGALDRFEENFPESRYIGEAGTRRSQLKTIRRETGLHLERLGYFPGGGISVTDADLRHAVEAYENRLGLPARGRVDASLVETLKAAADERERLDTKLKTLTPLPDTNTTKPVEQPKPISSTPSTHASPPAPSSSTPPTAQPELRKISAKASPSPKKIATVALETLKDCDTCPTLVVVPEGTFVMGDTTGRGAPDETPLRQVKIDSFAIGQTEVTFAEWDACHQAGACKRTINDLGWGRGDRPLMNISWQDAQDYTAWLSQKTGHTYRLPSEAEWEYAARAGSDADYSFGNELGDICTYANGADRSTQKTYSWSNMACDDGVGRITAKVGRFKPNAWQLYDMHGNVWEWVTDCYHENYTGAPLTGKAWDTGCTNNFRILRGGAFSVQPNFLRSAYRNGFDPDAPSPFFGMRIARDLNAQK